MRILISLLTGTIVCVGCSRLTPLTEELLISAEQRWVNQAPGLYRVVFEMKGERVETGMFDVLVRDGVVVTLKRNGLVVLPNRGQDYSMEGLFEILTRELMLAQNPAVLGAPEGFTVHLLVSFDKKTGALKLFRRSVAGSKNNIEIKVLEYIPQ